MAPNLATMAALDAFTKEFYADDWFSQLNPKTPLLSGDVVKRGGQEHIRTDATGGREFNFPALFGMQESIGWIADGGAWPQPGTPSGVSSTFKAVYHLGTIGLTGATISLMRDNKRAFVSAFELNAKAAVDNFHMDWATALYQDGNGAIGQVKTVAGAGPYTIQLVMPSDVGTTPTGFGSAVTPAQVFTPINFRMNMQFTANTQRNGQGTARAGTGVITAADPYLGVLTCSSIPTGLAAGDYLFMNALGGGNLLMGLVGIVDDGTFQGTLQNISRTSYPLWKSPVLSNGGTARPLTLTLIRQMVSAILKVGGSPKVVVSDFTLRDDYISTLQPDIRFGSTKEFNGGFVGAPYDLPDGRTVYWLADQYSPYGSVFFLDTDYLRHFEAEKEHWDDQTGSIWRQGLAYSGSNVTGFADAYWAAYKWYGQFGTYRPNTSGCIRDLSE